jgi:poly(hydroxyalkanoate) granule-associated protein
MAKQTKSRRAAAKAGVESRDLLLAGLGAVSLTRKQGIKLYGVLVDEGKQYKGRVDRTIEGLQGQARIGAELVRERVETLVTPIRNRAEAAYGSVRTTLQARFPQALARLGVKPAAKARTVKRATKAKPAKRVVRKARAA